VSYSNSLYKFKYLSFVISSEVFKTGDSEIYVGRNSFGDCLKSQVLISLVYDSCV